MEEKELFGVASATIKNETKFESAWRNNVLKTISAVQHLALLALPLFIVREHLLLYSENSLVKPDHKKDVRTHTRTHTHVVYIYIYIIIYHPYTISYTTR